jgi:hypothetical protein
MLPPLGRRGRHPGCAVQRHPWQPPRLPACRRVRRRSPLGELLPTAATVLRECATPASSTTLTWRRQTPG